MLLVPMSTPLMVSDWDGVRSKGFHPNLHVLKDRTGLRNSVGVAEEPITGGIYSVENSVDQISRDNRDVHQDNPAEEMNYHGFLNGTEYALQGSNYGYPNCMAAWRPDLLPNNTNITVGTQFKLDDFPTTDATCMNDRTPPRLSFQAHMAPLDLKFNPDGSAAWVTFHGSWYDVPFSCSFSFSSPTASFSDNSLTSPRDRTNPTGYKLSVIEFAAGAPVAPANSSTAAIDIFANADNSACPDGCFRPVAMAWDKQGRLFVSSDATGEIYMITRSDGQATNASLPQAVVNGPRVTTSAGGSSPTGTGGGSGSGSGSSSSKGVAPTLMPGPQVAMGVGLGVGLLNFI